MKKNSSQPEQYLNDDEINDLRKELEHFQQEKERVRKIVGKIGGVPTFNAKLINLIFAVVLAGSVVISVFISDAKIRLLMIEVATVTLALKIIYLIHMQMKVGHFQLWMLSSIEWRLNEMMKVVRKLEKKQD